MIRFKRVKFYDIFSWKTNFSDTYNKKVSHEDGFFNVKGRHFSALAFRFDGKGEFEVYGKKIISGKGDLLFLPANTPYKVQYCGSEIVVIHMTNCNYNIFENKKTDNYNFFSACFNELLEYWDKTHCVNGAKSRIYKIFQKMEEGEKSFASDDVYIWCRSYIEQHFSDCDIDIATVCKNNFVSEAGLRRKFHTYAGMSPKQYLIKLRIDKAVSLLTDGNYSVKEIAELCGFSDEKYFSRAVKKKYGIPPSMFLDKI